MEPLATPENLITRRDVTNHHRRKNSAAAELPFTSESGKPFKLAIDRDILSLLSEISKQIGALTTLRISDDFMTARKKQIQQAEAYFSSILDTEEVPYEEALVILGGKQSFFQSPARQRIFNHQLVLQKIYLHASKPGTKVSKDLIKELEAVFQGGTHDPDAGNEYRTGPVYIEDGTGQIVYSGPPPAKVNEMMPGWIEWMNAPPQNHPLIDAALGQLFFLHIHPLSDFNGCIARAMTRFYLIKHGYECVRLFSLSEAIFQSRAAYYQAIHAAECDEQDATVFVVYFLEVFQRQITDAIQALTKGPLNVKGLTDLLDPETRKSLNRRQTAALRWLIKNDQRLSTRVYCKLNKCADETARKDFQQLVALDIIRSIGAGRSVEYELKPGEIAQEAP